MVVFVNFGIISVRLFGARLYSCNDGNAAGRWDCVGSFEQNGVLQPRVWTQPDASFDNIGKVCLTCVHRVLQNCEPSSECLGSFEHNGVLRPRVWTQPDASAGCCICSLAGVVYVAYIALLAKDRPVLIVPQLQGWNCVKRLGQCTQHSGSQHSTQSLAVRRPS